ncbi:protein of unknown function DUF324 [Thermoanaerobacterium xylanolyticum LX-11]|uniref:CRISPR type III-associated protein domain-containing protein n=1 Tax=Thermoanaerobacterium xylanolyticum (strain ATCC 49914 / DSM 7097 / LX-11) TaxID=858215 RepID=F6BLT4_THEXL|nr:RAMP superfamily CRISPR-associated protein [Thermoanaerobacterium xylanolyticum]AEF18285.1 protein of unknown function DUF324 [Thermoanaerobacterium xylanolyticum LX-11]
MKPYNFVPILGAKKYVKSHELKSGKVRVSIEVVTPVHIFSGYYNENGSTVYREFAKYNGKYIIPGSSLKGCARAIAESVSRSCISTKQDIRKIGKDIKDQNDCIICDMFGSLGKKSRLRFTDLVLVKNSGVDIINIPAFYGPKPENKNYYDADGKFKGVKFYNHGDVNIIEKGTIPCEFVMPGSIFEGDVFFDDLDDNELDLLCFSLGLSGDIYLKLGYGKPAYYGSVKVKSIDDDIDALKRANRYGENDGDVAKNVKRLKELLSWDKRHTKSVWHTVNNQRGY